MDLLVALDAADTELLVAAVNYGEALVYPSREPRLLMRAIDALRGAGIRVLPADGVSATVAAGYRAEGVSLADGFALAAASEHRAALATFDQRVRRAAEADGTGVFPR